jgi:hypothetical protein
MRDNTIYLRRQRNTSYGNRKTADILEELVDSFRVGLDTWKFLILPELELRPLGLPARSQLLYRLRYRKDIYEKSQSE